MIITLQLILNYFILPANVKSLTLNDKSISSPLDQFEIRDLLSIDAPILANLHLSITNIGLYLTIAALIALTVNILAVNYNRVVANK